MAPATLQLLDPAIRRSRAPTCARACHFIPPPPTLQLHLLLLGVVAVAMFSADLPSAVSGFLQAKGNGNAYLSPRLAASHGGRGSARGMGTQAHSHTGTAVRGSHPDQWKGRHLSKPRTLRLSGSERAVWPQEQRLQSARTTSDGAFDSRRSQQPYPAGQQGRRERLSDLRGTSGSLSWWSLQQLQQQQQQQQEQQQQQQQQWSLQQPQRHDQMEKEQQSQHKGKRRVAHENSQSHGHSLTVSELTTAAGGHVAPSLSGIAHTASSSPSSTPPSSSWDEGLAELLVQHAAAVYVEDSELLRTWKCARCQGPLLRNFRLTTLVVDRMAELKAYVGVDHGRRMVVVVFRGTHSTYIRNWIDDIAALELPIPYLNLRNALVHQGFFSAYHRTQLRPSVTQAVADLRRAHPDYTVAVTGHSLGAAIASFCALDLVVNFNVSSGAMRSLTFGSPRIGNAVFAASFNARVPTSTRVTHERDIVVHLPPRYPQTGLLAYHHVAQEVWFHRLSPALPETPTVCDGTGEDDDCSRSIKAPSISDHLCYMGVSLRSSPTLCAHECGDGPFAAS